MSNMNNLAINEERNLNRITPQVQVTPPTGVHFRNTAANASNVQDHLGQAIPYPQTLSPRASSISFVSPPNSAPASYVEGYAHSEISEPEDTQIQRYSGNDDVEKVSLRDQNFSEKNSARYNRPLNLVDVVALIVNKMIGTGIFTTPGIVLQLTGSKGISIMLWVFGGLFDLLYVSVYVDYGTAFVGNGGELIPLSSFGRSKRSKLFGAVIFSVFFITVSHTGSNALTFARNAVALGNISATTGNISLNSNTVKGVATLFLTAVCLLHYFTIRLGLFLNRLFFVIKGLLLLTIALWGIGFAITHHASEDSGVRDWSWHKHNNMKTMSAFIYIIYSYNGWESGNYINGELMTHRKTLRNGAFIAVALVTVLYTLVVTAYFLVCRTETIIGPQDELNIALVFAKQLAGQRFAVALDIMICISAIGNMISVVYTCSRVKQAIALYHGIPFATFFAADSHFRSPGGALLLHWISSTVAIVAVPNTTGGYSFLIGIFEYCQLLVGAAMGFGFPFVERVVKRERRIWRSMYSDQFLRWVVGFSLGFFNISILVIFAIHTWGWALILGIVITTSFAYFSILILATEKRVCGNGGGLLSWVGWEANLITPDEKRKRDKVAKGKNDDYSNMNEKTKMREEGTTVIVEHKVNGFLEWFPGNRIRRFIEIVAPPV